MPVFKQRARSLRQLLQDSARFRERTYLVDGDTRIDYDTHLQLVDGLAVALREVHGVRPADRVAIFAANRWEWVVAFWAVATVGAIPAPTTDFGLETSSTMPPLLSSRR